LHSIPEMIPGRTNCFVTDINDAGQITVISCTTTTDFISFLWDSKTGETVELGDLPGGNVHTTARALNNLGDIVGESATGWNGDSTSTEAFLWTRESGIRSLSPLEDGIVPYWAFGINDNGQVAGMAILPTSGERFAFLWSPNAPTTLIPLDSLAPPPESVVPTGFNNAGSMVGYARYSQSERAIIWTPGRGVRLLQDLRDPCDRSNRTITFAGAINDAGVIAAFDDESCGRGDSAILLLTPYLVGDFDANAAVDPADVSILLSHFGQLHGAGFADGDTDCDGD